MYVVRSDYMDSESVEEFIRNKEWGPVDIESAVRGSEPTFEVIEPRQYHMIKHEKRVNQAGFKGVYQVRLNY